MPKIEFEILRTREVTIEENATVEVEVPARTPEDEREEWVLDQLEKGKLEIPDSVWDVSDETEHVDYQEVTEL
jgi:hypothetical protein